MRLLLDSCIPRKLASHIKEHDVLTAREMGWSDLKDGALLDAMDDEFDVLVTVDRSLPFQQRLEDRRIAIVVLRSRSNRLAHLARLIPALRPHMSLHLLAH